MGMGNCHNPEYHNMNTYLPTYLINCLFTYLLTYSLTHSLTHAPTHSLTHSMSRTSKCFIYKLFLHYKTVITTDYLL